MSFLRKKFDILLQIFEKLGVMYGILSAFGLFFIIERVWSWLLDGFYSLSPFYNIILIIVLGLALVLSVISFIINAQKRLWDIQNVLVASQAALAEAKQELVETHASLSELQVKQSTARSTIVDFERLSGAYLQNNSQFLLLSQNNAHADRDVFDIFFNNMLSPTPKREDIEICRKIIKENIQKNVEKLVVMFDTLTGDQCAVCIKLVNIDDESMKNIENAFLVTFCRDERSLEARKYLNERQDRVYQNDGDVFLFQKIGSDFPNQIYVEDDLKNKKGYRNARSDWHKHYNATIVCGIPDLDRNRGDIPWVGLLCVDNKIGGLTSENSIHYVKEVAFRLSVMIYREKKLSELNAML